MSIIHGRGFKLDCPSGQLDREKLLAMYTLILPAGNAKIFVDQIFKIFDKDGDGSIDFKVTYISKRYLNMKPISQEFLLATDMKASGTAEEKLRWAFKMYDADCSGEWKLFSRYLFLTNKK